MPRGHGFGLDRIGTPTTENTMDQATKEFILDLLQSHHYMTVATVRPDGWPQATTVAYASDGLTLYFACDPDGQKVANIRQCDKVSVAIDRDYPNWEEIRGLSLGGTAQVVTDDRERQHAQDILRRKFPQWAEMPEPEDPALIAFVKVTPKVISVLDYTKGFGHTRLVEV
jgi:nitroimidazol reductase NimA-like FMN-containing flavoprotein (pyridoxamine 5'-phosphate oxidase superfamily)